MPRRPNENPSAKQLEVLRHIIAFVEQHGYQPTLAEMAATFEVTKNAIQSRLKELRRHGLVELPPGRKRRERALVIKHVRFKASLVIPTEVTDQ
jgi:SOS-response transcriptional repressor LexA